MCILLSLIIFFLFAAIIQFEVTSLHVNAIFLREKKINLDVKEVERVEGTVILKIQYIFMFMYILQRVIEGNHYFHPCIWVKGMKDESYF